MESTGVRGDEQMFGCWRGETPPYPPVKKTLLLTDIGKYYGIVQAAGLNLFQSLLKKKKKKKKKRIHKV